MLRELLALAISTGLIAGAISLALFLSKPRQESKREYDADREPGPNSAPEYPPATPKHQRSNTRAL